MLIHAVQTDQLVNEPITNYLIVNLRISNKIVRGLVDTGAQATVIKQSCVPIGTPVVNSDLQLRGVKGPPITICGTADIYMEVGGRIFKTNCVVMPDEAIDFPAGCDVIMGVNMLAQEEIDVSVSKWALMKQGQILQKFEPAEIDGRQFSAAEWDYYNHGLSDKDMEANTIPSPRPGEENWCTISDQKVVHDCKKNQKIYPNESSLWPQQEAKSIELEQQSCRDNRAQASRKASFYAATLANISLEPSALCMIKISIRDNQGLPAPTGVAYGLEGGSIQPGVIVLEGITEQRDTIAVLNYTSERIPLYRDVPISPAEVISEEDILVSADTNHKVDLRTPDVYTLMAMSAITEEAYVLPQEYSSDTDELQVALDYDPSQISTKEVIYDSQRADHLLELLGAETWKLTSSQRKAAEKVLRKRQKAFNLPREPLPKTHLIEHHIMLKDPNKVIHVKPRWTPIHQRPHVEKELQGMLDHDLAVPTTSPYNSPIVLVRKKGNKWRLATDFRRINADSIGLFYPVGNIEEVVFRISQSKVHSRFDMRNGFMQIGLGESSQPISAFSCHKGHFMYKRLPFGLSSGPHTLNKLMDIVFKDMSNIVSTFFDDIFCHSDSMDQHMEDLDQALGALIEANLQVSPEKSKLFTRQVEVLGHIVGGGEIKPGLDKVQAIREFPVPKTRTNVRSFLGLTGFFRKFVRDYAKIAKPLTILTGDSEPFIWSSDQQEAFEALKSALMSSPVLKAPDFNRCWFLVCDACDIGIAAWLGQRYEGKLHPVAYFSRQLRKTEKTIQRDAMELETLAILEGLKKFRPLIWGQKIIVLSDNSPLQWLFKRSIYKSARLTRWAMAVAGFNVELLHYPGSLNKVADSLSRNPPLEIDDKVENSALKILEECEEYQVAFLGLYPKDEPPPQKEVLLKVLAIRANQPDAQDTDLEQAWTLEELKQAQRKDVLLKPIIDFLLSPTDMNRMKVDPNVKNLSDYFLDQNGVLFIEVDDQKAEFREGEEVLVIPHKYQQLATSIIHDTAIGGHSAADNTLFAAKRRFYWRNMQRTIKLFVNRCRTCQINKGKAHPRQPLRKYPLPDKPFDVVSTDLIGPLPLTSDGNRFILTVTDFLTRYVVVKALPNKSANEVAKGLWQVFCEHGAPSTLYSDSGSEFRNSVLKEMTKNFGVRHVTVAVYHPASNGLCERKNSSILTALRCFSNISDWDMVLPTAQLAVNAAYNRSLGDSSFFIYRGKDPELPATRFAKPRFSYAESLSFEQERQRREHQVMELVKEKLLEAADENCRQVQKKCKERTLQIDDRVFLRRIQKKGESKLVPRWKGPFRILAQKNPGVYKLKELLTGKVTEQHIENIKNGTLIMARESEIPLNECPQARKPYPSEQVQEGRPPRRVPEGAPDDDWYDDTFWLTPEEMEGAIGNNTLPTQNDVNADKQDGRRISPRRKK